MPISSGFVEILSLTMAAHTLVGFLLLSNHFLSQVTKRAVLFLKENFMLYYFWMSLNYFFGLLMISCLFVAKKKYKNFIWFTSVKNMVRYFRILAKLLIFSSSLLAYINLE